MRWSTGQVHPRPFWISAGRPSTFGQRPIRRSVINLTNHIYFNLNGNSTTSVEGYRLQLLSDRVAFRDPLNAPTGALVAVEASPLDLRNPQSLGDLIAAASDPRFTGPAVTGTGSGRSFLVDNRRGVQDALNPTVQNKD
jgi:galactose mutarotase-like enzyme